MYQASHIGLCVGVCVRVCRRMWSVECLVVHTH